MRILTFFRLLCIAPCLIGSGCSSGGAPASGHFDLAVTTPGSGDLAVGGTPADLAVLAQSEPDWSLVAGYLDSLYNPTLALLREYPAATIYNTTEDNGLGARAYQYLPSPNLTRRDDILNSLRSYKICGCQDLAEHDALLNHHVDPVVTKGAQIPTTPRTACSRSPENTAGPTGSCGSIKSSCPASGIHHQDYSQNGWYGDDCNFGACSTSTVSSYAADGPGKGAAELIALQILNRRNRSMPTDALWQTLLGKWDGKGIYDQATVDDHAYSTYKVALLKICARVLGQPLPAAVDEKLKAAQGPSGGIRTTYALDGNFTLDQKGNAATTSYVVLAYRKPVADF